MGKERGHRKRRVGVVVSDGMEKSVVVAVERRFRHPMYKKVLSQTTRFMAHDEENACRVGDKVELIETRPLSKRKRWRVTRILAKAATASTAGAGS